ncbi:hypothetical protein ABK040_008253 [Willaertia magna]
MQQPIPNNNGVPQYAPMFYPMIHPNPNVNVNTDNNANPQPIMYPMIYQPIHPSINPPVPNEDQVQLFDQQQRQEQQNNNNQPIQPSGRDCRRKSFRKFIKKIKKNKPYAASFISTLILTILVVIGICFYIGNAYHIPKVILAAILLRFVSLKSLAGVAFTTGAMCIDLLYGLLPVFIAFVATVNIHGGSSYYRNFSVSMPYQMAIYLVEVCIFVLGVYWFKVIRNEERAANHAHQETVAALEEGNVNNATSVVQQQTIPQEVVMQQPIPVFIPPTNPIIQQQQQVNDNTKQ